jgi:hypothetical protein
MTNVLPKGGGTLDQYPEFMRDLRTIVTIESNHKADENSIREQERQKQEALREIKQKVGRT